MSWLKNQANATIAAIVGFVGTLGAAAVGGGTGAVGAVPGPNAILGWVMSIPGMGIGWLAGIIEAVGLGALLAVMGWVAGRPTVAMVAVLATGIAYWNPGKVGDEIRFGIRLVILTVVGYVLAVWIAEPLVSSLGVVP